MGVLARIAEGRASAYAGQHPRDPAISALWGSGWLTESGISVTPDNAMRAPAVAASVRLVSETISTIPLDLFEVDARGEKVKAAGHPLHALVHDAPNDWLTSTDWRRRVGNGLLLRGNQYNRIGWGGDGMVQRLDPLPKGGVYPFRADNKIWYRVTDRTGSYVLPAMDVLHLRGPFQQGGYGDEDLVAESPVEIGKELIAQSIAAASYISRFFQNGAVPKLALEIPGEIKDNETVKRLRTRFEDRHKGLENAHKLAILESGMKLSPLAVSNVDAQLIELYKQTAQEIGGRLYGIPPHLSGDIEKQTSWGAGIEQMDLGYVKHCVRPYLVGIEQALSMSLLNSSTRGRFKFEFNVEGLLRGDFKSRMEGYSLLIQWGLATFNEIRRRENMPAIDGGDARMVPLNYAPADRIMDVLLRSPGKASRALRSLLAGHDIEEETAE